MLVLDYLLFYVYKLNLGFKNLEFLVFFRLFATENLDFPSKNYEVVSCASVQMSVWEATEKRWNPSKWDWIRRATSDLRSTLKPWYNEPWYSEFHDIVNKTQLSFWGFAKHITFDIVKYSI